MCSSRATTYLAGGPVHIPVSRAPTGSLACYGKLSLWFEVFKLICVDARFIFMSINFYAAKFSRRALLVFNLRLFVSCSCLLVS